MKSQGWGPWHAEFSQLANSELSWSDLQSGKMTLCSRRNSWYGIGRLLSGVFVHRAQTNRWLLKIENRHVGIQWDLCKWHYAMPHHWRETSAATLPLVALAKCTVLVVTHIVHWFNLVIKHGDRKYVKTINVVALHIRVQFKSNKWYVAW